MIRTLLAVSSLLAAVAAQRTVVVDQANGPGTNHTTLVAALNDLQANDRIVVRAGTYDGMAKSTQHSFSIHGEGYPTIVPPASTPWIGYAMQFTFWGGAGQRANLAGLRFESNTTGQWALTVATFQNNWPAPTVHLEDCRVESVSPQADRVGLLAQAIGLTVKSCELDTTQVIDAVASFETTTIHGHDASVWNGFTQRAQTAIDLIRSEAWFIDCNVIAGSSLGANAEPAACVGFSDSSVTRFSQVHACWNSTFVADALPGPGWPVPNVFQDYTSFWPTDPVVEYDPVVTFQPSPLGATFGAGVVPTAKTSITHQATIDAPLGGSHSMFVRAAIGDIVMSWASMASFATPVGSWELFLDPLSAVPIGVGVLTTSQVQLFAIAIPNNAALLGSVVETLPVSLSPAGVLDIGNPSAGMIR
ncbi:MAG: hypothetical protein JNK15_11295 [Planctomycetes bacterium]|nr:hypothetical protein [Planctomycetota bacterium]